MKIIDMEQGSEEWFKVRRGIISASHFSEIITTTGKPSVQAEKYLYRLAAETVSKTSEETYQNADMKRGIELEPEARQMYELINDVEVEQVGFCDAENGSGCSPDGLVGSEGGLEIKCPKMVTHVSYLLKGGLETDYFQQVQGSMYVTGRKWWDLMSYYPGIKPLIIRINRNEDFISKLDVEVRLCVKKLQDIINKIS